jgi:hypothetical protein
LLVARVLLAVDIFVGLLILNPEIQISLFRYQIDLVD